MTNLQVLVSAHNKLWKKWYRIMKWNGRLRKNLNDNMITQNKFYKVYKEYWRIIYKKTHCNQIIEILRKSYIIKLKT